MARRNDRRTSNEKSGGVPMIGAYTGSKPVASLKPPPKGPGAGAKPASKRA